MGGAGVRSVDGRVLEMSLSVAERTPSQRKGAKGSSHLGGGRPQKGLYIWPSPLLSLPAHRAYKTKTKTWAKLL